VCLGAGLDLSEKKKLMLLQDKETESEWDKSAAPMMLIYGQKGNSIKRRKKLF
jgi:hypothetical protein